MLNFSNGSFAAFVETCLGFDPYERYTGSKAVILRQIWLQEPMSEVAKLNLDLLEYWHLGTLAREDEVSAFESQLYEELRATFGQPPDPASVTSLEFLARDFGQLDLSALPGELSSQRVVEARLVEIGQCLEARAPLAVIFLAGSTLEGLLMEVALGHADRYTASPSAPKQGGRPKPLERWTLGELITVSRSLGVVGEDVLKHADSVREFRNYIHPRQQLREGFEPRMITAQIAQQVLLAALVDLESLPLKAE